MITILIAHRLSTVMHADRIYVLEHGQISEAGRHDEPDRHVAGPAQCLELAGEHVVEREPAMGGEVDDADTADGTLNLSVTIDNVADDGLYDAEGNLELDDVRTDVENVGLWAGRPYLIYTLRTGELAAWRIADSGIEPLPLR